MGTININKLNPHPKNDFYFTDITGDKYEEIKRSIDTYGIRDPLKVTTAYTIISGHQRYRIAADLNLLEVPVEIVDVDEWQAEYMLIAENTERRGEAEADPVKKGRQGAFLKEYWGVKNGGNKKALRQNGELRTMDQISSFIHESKRSTERLIKLNDLIPELQSLVSSGDIGVTAAEQLAYLTVEEQSILFQQKGSSLGDMTVDDMKNLRNQIEQLRQENEELRIENEALAIENNELKLKPKKTIEKIIDKTDYEKIKELTDKLDKERNEKKRINDELGQYKETVVKLGREISEFKEAREYENISPQAKIFVQRHLEIAEACQDLMQKISVVNIVTPTDLPYHVRENYKKLFYETGRLLMEGFEKLDNTQNIIEYKGE